MAPREPAQRAGTPEGWETRRLVASRHQGCRPTTEHCQQCVHGRHARARAPGWTRGAVRAVASPARARPDAARHVPSAARVRLAPSSPTCYRGRGSASNSTGRVSALDPAHKARGREEEAALRTQRRREWAQRLSGPAAPALDRGGAHGGGELWEGTRRRAAASLGQASGGGRPTIVAAAS